MNASDRIRISFVLLGSSALAAMPASADVLRVPQQFTTIQSAINAAADGDTVLVANGVYSGVGNYDLNPQGKAITIRSVHGPANCTIDATEESFAYSTGIMFVNNETAETVLDGFTITGGHMFNGGGIMISSGSPTIRNCIVTGNFADCWGAGIYNDSSSSPTISNTRITGNNSAAEGGGIFTIAGSLVLEGCSIDNNIGNIGGGVCDFGGLATFVNCQIVDNHASYSGGGAYLGRANLLNCTVAGNSADSYGSGLYVYVTFSNAVLTNTIVWNNTGTSAQIYGQPQISWSIIADGAPGEGNLVVAPRFVNAAAGDYRLGWGSPGIDAGSNFALPSGFSQDLLGAPRYFNDPRTVDTGEGQNPIIDIGAFEFRPSVLGGGLNR